MPYDNPLGASYSSNHSATSSYSDASSGTWDSSTVYTPMSTPRRGSPNSGSVKRESSAVSAPTPVSTPDRYANINGFNAMNALTQGIMVGYQQQMDFTPSQPTLAPEVNMPQVSMAEMDYGPYLDSSLCNSFTAYDGLPLCAPSLENELFSPMSDMSCPTPLSNSCVVPSQTNFMDLYTIQSPIKSLHLSMDYEHASPECDSGFSMSDCSPQSMRYIMPDHAEHQLPDCSTPSRPSNFRDARNGNDHGSLLDYQVPFYDKPTRAEDSEPKTPARREAPAAKLPRKKSAAAKREDRSSGGGGSSGKYGSITAVSRAGHFCSHPSCGGKFVRLEHLKRHGRTHQPPRSPVPCEFCKKIFPADRMDNIKAHVLRHAVPGARSRTQYHPDAYALWLSMEKKPRKGSAAAVSNNNNNSSSSKKKIKAEGGGQEGTAARPTTAGPGSRPRTGQAGCGGARSS